MQTPVEVFDEWLSFDDPPAYRFHPIPDQIAEPFKDQLRIFDRRMSAIKSQFRPGFNIDIYTDFIDDGTCNAAAGIHKLLGLIGLNRGMILLPQDIFRRMFSHPEFLKDVGDRSQERRTAQHSDGMTDDFDVLARIRLAANRPILPTPPKCPARHRMMEVCIDLVWRFVAMHELVHILHGHVDYLQSNSPAAFMIKTTAKSALVVPSRENLDRQSIEYWADAVGASTVLRGFLNHSPLVGSYAGLTDKRQRLFLWSFSLFTLFRIWGFKFDPATMHHESHPPSASRFALLIAGVGYDAVSDYPDISEHDYLKAVKSGQAAAEIGISYLGGDRLTQDDLDAMRDPKVIAHRQLLAEHFDNVLAPKLKQYAYINLRDGWD